ncbi:MAG: hypothetical protein Q7K57_30060 [Burkholderiaceae bacterium]|nr:hypothetical protein [Burkholderiaceae bacterium]
MSSISFIVVLVAIAPVISLAVWVWLHVVYADDELLSFSKISHQESLS